jgi:hypothetical protein
LIFTALLIKNISLHFLRLPEQISDDEINEYLTAPDNACKSQLPWMVLSFYAVFVCTYFPAGLLKSEGMAFTAPVTRL